MKSLIDSDVYWGEFSEEHMDALLSLLEKGVYDDAKKYIDETLKRTQFIFGKARSDFLYCMDLKKNSVCLDIGCGLGVHTFNLAPHVKEVHSIDLSKKRVQFCEYRKQFEKVSNVHLYHTDVDNLPFKDNTFDVILMNGVVEWLGVRNKNDNPRDDQVEVLKKIHSLLKPGGVLYIGIENRYAATYLRNARDHNRLKYTTFMPRWLANNVTQWKTGGPYRTYTYGISGYKKLLTDSGFDRAKSQFYIAHPGYNLPKYLVNFEDISALNFFMASIIQGRKYVSFLSRVTGLHFFLRTARHFFYSYAIFVKK